MQIPLYQYSTDFKNSQVFFERLIQVMQGALSDIGWTSPNQSTANITALTLESAAPVLPVGTIWFNTDLSKLQVLVTAAVPGASNGIVETVTSMVI